MATSDDRELFRREALDHHSRSRRGGEVLRLSPAWIDRAFWLLLAAVAAALAFACVARVDEYATGPAFVRIDGKRDITARSPGVVDTVAVVAGETVVAGQVVLELYAEEERAQAERARHELELQLVKVLAEPGDAAARVSLAGLRTASELAETRLAARTVRAPIDGIVGDVRARPGQQVGPGDALVSLVGERSSVTVVALLPGQYRPLLRRGGPLRLELSGYRDEHQALVLESIGDQILGPTEVARVVGREVADAVPAPGPVVLVTARLDAPTFHAQGTAVRYYDGMIGVARARIRSERVLFTLVPGLRPLLGADDV